MKLSPRYDGPVVLAIDDPPSSQLEPVTRQRRRFESMLSSLTDAQWAHPSRCSGWSNADVVAHLVSVNEFWSISVAAGLAGTPSRWLDGFDPAATPPLLVAGMGSPPPAELLDRFASTNDALLGTLAGLSDEEWEMLAEAPVGHVPIRLLTQHALWDGWIHERDIALPLGLAPEIEADEVASCVRYAAVISPVLAVGLADGVTVVADDSAPAAFAVDATGPTLNFVIVVGEQITLDDRTVDHADPPTPCLRGDAVELAEALSLRIPMPSSTPAEWLRLLGGLEAAFDAD